jgi:hypothetical protein
MCRVQLRKRGYTLELYSLTEVQQFSTEIFKALDDIISVDRCSAPVMWKIILKFKKKIIF